MAETTFTSSSVYAGAQTTASWIASKLPKELANPQVGIICGSGLGGLAQTVSKEPILEFTYGDIPGFVSSAVKGHAGKLVFGLLGEKKTPVVLMVGRVHFYEGHSIEKVTFPVRVLALLGISTIIVTNAAGGLNPEYHVGDVVVLNDHINFPGLAGAHPLRGPNIDSFGTRFPALSDAYDLKLRRTLHNAYKKLVGVSSTRRLHEGVYAFVSGPTFETRAECRMLRLLGADLVGMSTVPEICVARHIGLRVLAMSLVTNCAVLEPTPRGDDILLEEVSANTDGSVDINSVIEIGKANHEEVLASGKEAADDMQNLVRMFVDDLQV